MTKSEHTQGPWVAAEDGEIYSKPSYSSVAMVLMNDSGPDNATLIAAAPDLLDLLKRAAEADSNNEDTRTAWLDERDAVIAKAEGRS
jgi:hypothetical protein